MLSSSLPSFGDESGDFGAGFGDGFDGDDFAGVGGGEWLGGEAPEAGFGWAAVASEGFGECLESGVVGEPGGEVDDLMRRRREPGARNKAVNARAGRQTASPPRPPGSAVASTTANASNPPGPPGAGHNPQPAFGLLAGGEPETGRGRLRAPGGDSGAEDGPDPGEGPAVDPAAPHPPDGRGEPAPDQRVSVCQIPADTPHVLGLASCCRSVCTGGGHEARLEDGRRGGPSPGVRSRAGYDGVGAARVGGRPGPGPGLGSAALRFLPAGGQRRRQTCWRGPRSGHQAVSVMAHRAVSVMAHRAVSGSR